MEVARNAVFDGKRLILKGLDDEKLVKALGEKFNSHLESDGIAIPAGSVDEAIKAYKEVVKEILHTPHLEKLGFSFREIFNYRFLLYLSEYKDGVEKELSSNPLNREFDIVTLPDRDGYYYSTLYGIDNINIPTILAVGNLFARELMEIVESNPSLMELFGLKKISENVLRLERLGDAKLAGLARNLKKIEEIEEMIKKMLAVRLAFSSELAIAGNVEYAEIQKVRKLGNGRCIYLSKTLRDLLNIEEGDAVSVRVLAGNTFILITPLNRQLLNPKGRELPATLPVKKQPRLG